MSLDGQVTGDDLIEVFSVFEAPARGIDWWRVFAVNCCNEGRADPNATYIADRLGLSTTFSTIARNDELIEWICEQGIHKCISVDALSSAKKVLWNSDNKIPNSDNIAEATLSHIQANPGVSKTKLLSFIDEIQ